MQMIGINWYLQDIGIHSLYNFLVDISMIQIYSLLAGSMINVCMYANWTRIKELVSWEIFANFLWWNKI